jgi:hypothetical protein
MAIEAAAQHAEEEGEKEGLGRLWTGKGIVFSLGIELD